MIERNYLNDTCPSLDDFKRHLRITSDDMDDTLLMYLHAAINAAEHFIGQVIAVSEFVYSGACVESLSLHSPLIKVNEVVVNDIATDYSIVGRELRISAREGTMKVSYVAGMAQVPFDIKVAILLTASKLFNNPVDTVEALPSVSQNLLRPHRCYGE